MGIGWDVGTKLWLVPLRYWEKTEPEECEVVEEIERSDQSCLFVSNHQGQVYVPAERCFKNRKAAIEAAQLLQKLRELKSEDELEWIIETVDRQFANVPSAIVRRKKGYTHTGYVVIPAHHAKQGSLGRVPIDSFGKPTFLFWDYQPAQKALIFGMHPCPYAIVEVQVTPISLASMPPQSSGQEAADV